MIHAEEEAGSVALSHEHSPNRADDVELAAAEHTLPEVLERITDGIVALDRGWRFTYLNEAAVRMLGRSRSALLGSNVWETLPGIAELPVYASVHEAMRAGGTTTCTVFYPPRNAWFECRAYPAADGLSVYVREITDQKRAEEAMVALLADVQRANRDLEQLNAAKNEFISTVSHEFRTPLTSIQGFSELIMSEVTTLDEAQAFARTINENALRLARMIGDMLDLDHLESGQLVPTMIAADLNGLVRGVLEALCPTTQRHRLVAELDPSLPEVRCDPDLMVRVITNLVGNAIKYAPAGGPITVRTGPHRDGVELTVADEGLGVPPDHRETVFARYGRIVRPEQQGIEGTGLGLPIARQILEAHNGRIWVEPNTPVGSVFHVVLPAADSIPRPPLAHQKGGDRERA